jgi:transglutaminase-like putative cysteine protease
MIYDIRLQIGCAYPSAVADARHLLYVRPRDDSGQRVHTSTVVVSPDPDEHHHEHDFFGNPVEDVAFRRPHGALAVEMRARVRVDRIPVDLAATPTADAIADAAITWRSSDALSPIHFLGRSRRIVPASDITAYAAASLHKTPQAGPAVLALARRIQDEFAYEPGATDVRTGVAEAFARRRGVCQDLCQRLPADRAAARTGAPGRRRLDACLGRRVARPGCRLGRVRPHQRRRGGTGPRHRGHGPRL